MGLFFLQHVYKPINYLLLSALSILSGFHKSLFDIQPSICVIVCLSFEVTNTVQVNPITLIFEDVSEQKCQPCYCCYSILKGYYFFVNWATTASWFRTKDFVKAVSQYTRLNEYRLALCQSSRQKTSSHRAELPTSQLRQYQLPAPTTPNSLPWGRSNRVADVFKPDLISCAFAFSCQVYILNFHLVTKLQINYFLHLNWSKDDQEFNLSLRSQTFSSQ